MRAAKERSDFVHEFLNRVFIDDLHAKRILSLANGTLGVMTGAALAVSLIGQALAQARGLLAKSAIKQVDRLLSNAGVVPWDLFGSWVRAVVGVRREIPGSKPGDGGDGLDRFRRRQSVHARAASHHPPRTGHAAPLAHRRQGRTEEPAQRFRGPVPVPPEGAPARRRGGDDPGRSVPDQVRGSATSSCSSSWKAWTSDTSSAFAATFMSARRTAKHVWPPIGSVKPGGRVSCAMRKSPPRATRWERSCAGRPRE